MDFGDILNQWEHGKRNPKKPPEGKEGRHPEEDETFKKKVHPMEAWLRINKVIDKDALPPGEPEQDYAAERRRLRLKKPDDSIDIHGLTREQAWDAMEQFFDNSYRRGREKVLIIHGKGNHSPDKAVLKHCVRDFIEKCAVAGESGQDDIGGSGATWVLLKHKAGKRQQE